MHPKTKFWAVRILCAAVVIAGLITLARGQEEGVATGLFCDTPEQVEKWAAYLKEDAPSSIKRVNAEYGEHSCVVDTVYLKVVSVIKTIQMPKGLTDIIAVEVRGVMTPRGMAEIEPLKWFTLRKSADVGA